jgi:hypothetical protein
MKKILIITSILFIFSLKPVFAQTSDLVIPTDSITPALNPTPNTAEYTLPYPGVLPGSPMYILKEARDTIFETLTTDPHKKANRYLQQADKRLATGLELFERGDKVGAEDLIARSLISLEKSQEKAIETKNSGENIYDVSPKLKMSCLKQKEEIKNLLNKTDGELHRKFEKDYNRAVVLEKSANQIN